MPTIQHEKKLNRGLIGGVIAAVLVVVAAFGLVYGWHFWQSMAEKQAYDNAMQHADLLDRQSQFKEEESVLADYIKTNPPQQYRYKPLMRLGNVAFNQHNYKGALTYYQQAVAANGGKMQLIDAESMAMAAAAAADKEAAIKYYKQAISLTKVQPGVRNDIDEFKIAIKKLGGTP